MPTVPPAPPASPAEVRGPRGPSAVPEEVPVAGDSAATERMRDCPTVSELSRCPPCAFGSLHLPGRLKTPRQLRPQRGQGIRSGFGRHSTTDRAPSGNPVLGRVPRALNPIQNPLRCGSLRQAADEGLGVHGTQYSTRILSSSRHRILRVFRVRKSAADGRTAGRRQGRQETLAFVDLCGSPGNDRTEPADSGRVTRDRLRWLPSGCLGEHEFAVLRCHLAPSVPPRLDPE